MLFGFRKLDDKEQEKIKGGNKIEKFLSVSLYETGVCHFRLGMYNF